MKRYSHFLRFLFFIFLSIILFYSCSKDDNEVITSNTINSYSNTGTEANNEEVSRLENVLSSKTVTTNFNVSVNDEDGTPIQTATVAINETTKLTDENGKVLLKK